MEVEWIYEYLKDFEICYNSICTFDSIFETKKRLYDLTVPGQPMIESDLITPHMLQKHGGSYTVGISDRLVLKGVFLQSPGFWDFLGKLNPLEVIRQYLNDRHERKKDTDFRNNAEETRLRLENMRLENKVLNERLQIAEKIGYSKDDLEPLFASLVAVPLEKLDSHQDRNVIEHAEQLVSSHA